MGNRQTKSEEVQNDAAIWSVFERTQSIRATAEACGLSGGTIWRRLHQDPHRYQALLKLRHVRVADEIENIQDKILKQLRDMIGTAATAKMTFKDWSVALAILVEKGLLMRGEATSISATAVDEDAVLAKLCQQIESAGGSIRLPPQTVARLVRKGLLPEAVLADPKSPVGLAQNSQTGV